MTPRRGAALILLGACSASPSPAGTASDHAAPVRATPADATPTGAQAMTDLVRELVTLLSQDITLDDITARLGPIAEDPGVPMPAELASRDPAVRRVAVGRYPDTGKPFTVELELASPVPVAALVAAFGAYRQGRTDRGRPREIWFPPAGTGTWKIVIIAQLPPGKSPIAEGEAGTIILRRDARS